jgi:hypothetical protein
MWSRLACVHSCSSIGLGLAALSLPACSPRSACESVTADQPSKLARWRRLCSSSAKRSSSRDCCFSAQAWSAEPGTPPWPAPAAATKPEVNLDCVRVVARGRVLVSIPRRSPPSVFRYRYSTACALDACASGHQDCSSASSSSLQTQFPVPPLLQTRAVPSSSDIIARTHGSSWPGPSGVGSALTL